LKLSIGITGASGVIYGVRFLEELKKKGVEVHLMITSHAAELLRQEMGVEKEEIVKIATHYYPIDDLTAPIASGSVISDGLVVIPCSMKTLAGIAHGYADNLLLRVADVTLKEKRTLIIVPRETPLNLIHLENMVRLAKMGVLIIPAMPAFYYGPRTVDDIVNHIVGKVLDSLKIDHNLYTRWEDIINIKKK